MSVQQPDLTTIEGKLQREPEEWKHLRKREVFQASDKRINSLHHGVSNGLRNMRGRGITFDEQMHEETPFPSDASIRYDLELNQNMDFDGSESLDWSELDVEKDEGHFYQFNLNESIVYNEGTEFEEVVQGENLGSTDLDTELLEIHALVYENEDGQRHLMHWDPGVYDEEGEKHKYEERNGSPDLMEVAESEEDEFENYDVMELEEGLDHIYDELIEGSEEIEQSAHQQMLENSEQQTSEELGERPYEQILENSGQKTDHTTYSDQVLEGAWKAERWRGMADAVRNLKTSIQEGYGQEQRISF